MKRRIDHFLDSRLTSDYFVDLVHIYDKIPEGPAMEPLFIALKDYATGIVSEDGTFHADEASERLLGVFTQHHRRKLGEVLKAQVDQLANNLKEMRYEEVAERTSGWAR